MIDPRPSVPVVRTVRDQYGDRIVVTLNSSPPELTCDCIACRAELQGATTVENENLPPEGQPSPAGADGTTEGTR
jgi:hypothetical protein